MSFFGQSPLNDKLLCQEVYYSLNWGNYMLVDSALNNHLHKNARKGFFLCLT